MGKPALASRLPSVDVLIVGGGATGAGVLRDLARRGLRCLLVEMGDLGSGTTGRYHGLLHSGGRYVVGDPQAARECIEENTVLRRIAAACLDDTGGYFVATAADPDDYADAFSGACIECGVPCDEIAASELLRLEPALDPGIKRAFRVPDASLRAMPLILANVADARSRGSDALPYQRAVGFDLRGDRIVAAQLRDERTGESRRVEAGSVVSAAGAWAGRVAALAGVTLDMILGKGTMLVFERRLTQAVINRCHPPADGDILVPVTDASILGTTDVRVDDPDVPLPTEAEIETLMREGSVLIPGLRSVGIRRAYAGVRPLYDQLVPGAAGAGDRSVTRSHVVVDHAVRDGIENLVSVVGGKVTTYRLMAEQTADLVTRKLGLGARCTTAEEPLPPPEPAKGA